MNPELTELLIILGCGTIIGLMGGLGVRLVRPDWAMSWARFCMRGQWKLFALGACFFAALGLWSWVDGRVFFAGAFFAMCLLELVTMAIYGFRSGFPTNGTTD